MGVAMALCCGSSIFFDMKEKKSQIEEEFVKNQEARVAFKSELSQPLIN